MKIQAVSESSLIVYVSDEINLSMIANLARFTAAIESQFNHAILDVIPSYTSILIDYHPLKLDVETLKRWCQQHWPAYQKGQYSDAKDQSNSAPVTLTLPVYYHPEVGLDLDSLAAQKNLSVAQVIEKHTQQDYTVCAIGFAPGFAFLGAVDPAIATPRHAKPRLKVKKGSVGIADQQTAVYPLDTPGGWQIIGNCPIDLFDIDAQPMMPFKVGDTIRFEAIDRDTFLQLGGQV